MKKLIVTTIGIALLFACKSKKESPTPISTEDLAIENYAAIAYANYKDAYEEAIKLQNGIKDFCSNPTEDKFKNLKVLYVNARIPYEQTEPFRTANGPIDTGTDAVEGRLNGWPLAENFVDYIEKDSTTGIINDKTNYPTITSEVLIENHEKGGESNLTLGYHVIEFLLWGQDLNVDPNTAGQRKFTDYTTLKNADRRKEYLIAATDILIADLKYVMDAWAPESSFRKSFVASDSSFQYMVRGIAWFTAGELPTERMYKAVENKDQEEEHSCFSDLTDQDIKLSMKGVNNLIYGKYVTSSGDSIIGKGIIDVLNEKNTSGATLVKTKLNTALVNSNAIPAPFDQAIINTPETIVVAKNSIFNFSNSLQEAAYNAGYKLVIPE